MAPVSLRWVLGVPLVLQTVGVVVLVGYLSYQSGQQAIANLAQQLMQSVDQQVTQELDRYLYSAHAANQRNLAAVAAGAITPENLDLLHRYLILQHRQNQDLTTLLLGTREGNLRLSHRVRPEDYDVTTRLRPDELPFEVAISESTDPDTNRTYSVNPAGDRGRLLETVENIDVRDRPWYRQAIATGKPGWVGPFQVGSTNLLALNAYAPLYDAAGQVSGVFAVNISLNQLSDFLRGLKIGRRGQVFILERSGWLVASSTPEPVYTVSGQPDLSGTAQPGTLQFQRRSPANLADPRLQQSYETLKRQFNDLTTLQAPQTLQLSLQGERYFLSVSPYRDAYGLDWLVVTQLPEADFTGEIQQNIRITVLLCLLALVAAIASSSALFHRLTSRIVRLQRASQALAAGDLTQQLPANSKIAEARAIAQSFNQMATQLQQSFRQQVDLKATRQSQARFQELAAAVPGMIYTYTQQPDGSHGFEYVSSFSRTLLELEPEQLIADRQAALNQIHPEDRPDYAAAATHSLTHLEPFSLTFRVHTPSGQLKWLEVNSHPLHHPDGSITWYGIALDVSDRRRAEVALRQSEQKFSTIFHDSPQPAWTATLAEGRCLDINEGFSRVLGYSRTEVIGKTCQELHLWHQPQDLQHFRNSLLQTGSILNQEVLFRTQSGTLKTVLLSACVSRLDDQECVVGVLSDISDRKQLETSLRETKQALKDILDNTLAAITRFRVYADGTWEYEYRSAGAEAVFGYRPEAFLENPQLWESRVPLEDQAIASIAHRVKDVFAGRTFSVEYRFRHRDGSLRWLSNSLTCRHDADTDCWIVTGVDTDITERKRIEQILRQRDALLQQFNRNLEGLVQERTEQLNLAIATARLGIWQQQMGQEHQYWSPENYALLGFKTDDQGRVLDLDGHEIAPYPTYELFLSRVHPDDQEQLRQAQRPTAAGSLQGRSLGDQEYRVVWPDGTVRWHQSRGGMVYDARRQVSRWTGVSLDITEMKQAEEQVRNSLHEKEVLLSEIHHRVKNNLQIICSLVRLQAHRVEDATLAELLRETQDRVQSMALIHEMLYQSPNFAGIDLGQYLEALTQQLLRSYGAMSRDIRATVAGDPILLSIEQSIPCGLIANELVSNALKHAFPDGKTGRIQVSLRWGDVPRQVVLAVQDNGVGLPAAIAWQTRDSLGLQIVQSLVRQLGGTLECDAPEGDRGTRFAIRFCLPSTPLH